MRRWIVRWIDSRPDAHTNTVSDTEPNTYPDAEPYTPPGAG
jgi:hypothetical protein